MSVSPYNTNLARLEAEPRPDSWRSNVSEQGGHEALEALLAFCALHQQAHDRRARGQGRESAGDPERQELEQFVFDEVLQLVAERALVVAGADGVAIALVDENAIVCRASAGTVTPDRGTRVDLNSGFSGACLVSRKVVRCDDSETDSRVSAEACRSLGVRSMVAVPLTAKESVIGLIEAFSSVPYGFNDSDVRTLRLLAELILAALRPEEEQLLVEASQRVVSPEPSAIATTSPVVTHEEESAVEAPAEVGEHPAQEQDVSPASEDSAKPARSLRVVVTLAILGLIALLILGLTVGRNLGWKIGRQPQPSPVVQPPAATSPPPVATSAAPPADTAPPGTPPAVSPPGSDASHDMPEVTGIRHWSAANSSTVVIDMDDQVQYEAHRLADPERIYFDLHDTRLSADLAKSIEINDSLIQRVRVAQPEPGLTRVVIEIKGPWNFSVSLAPNPYRLVVEVSKSEGAPRARSQLDLFTPGKLGGTAIVPAPGGFTPRLRIVLDAGHGGSDLGTSGRQGLLEKDVVLDIVARLGLLLRRLGADVTYTRRDDSYVALEKRAEIANLSGADLFLSIHANSSDFPSARGVETYYTNTYSSTNARARGSNDSNPGLRNVNWTGVDIRAKVRDSHQFATSIQQSLYSILAPKNPGLRNRGVKEAQYVVLTGTMMPAVLAEISFVSSPADENHLQNANYRQEIAQALYQGIERFVEQSRRVKRASAENQHKLNLNR